MIFDYMRMVSALDTIEIDDIGNTCINTLNDYGEEWYLIINTHEGWTEIVEFGPLVVDSNNLKTYFTYDKYSYEYSDKKIGKVIDKFINNNKRDITQVFEVTKDQAKNRLELVKHCL